MQLFPAVIIGGPPDSGKSVLTYHLSQALRRRGVQHYVLRANPDGEGDWAIESDQALVRTILVPKKWTPAFVDHVCHSLSARHLPLLVDVGGRPRAWQEAIFDHCTHAILLTPDSASQLEWQQRVQAHDLMVLADLRSSLTGPVEVTDTEPLLRGTISGLIWGQPLASQPFEMLVERLARLLAYDRGQLRRRHLQTAPVENAVDLDRLAHSLNIPFEGEKANWQPVHLPRVLEYLPYQTPLGLYGRGTNWLYTAAALHTQPAQFYQFDVRLGWVTPPLLTIGLPAADAALQYQQQVHEDFTELIFSIRGTHLDYDRAANLTVPVPPQSVPLVINGQLPYWLTTALAITYRHAPLLAVHQPQADGHVVVSSKITRYKPGDVL